MVATAARATVTDQDAAPKPPTGLDKIARREWKRLTADLVFAATELSALATYCQAYSHWLEALAIVRREGLTISTPIVNRSTGNIVGHKIARHPATTVGKDERAAMLQISNRLGFYSDAEDEGDDATAQELKRILGR